MIRHIVFFSAKDRADLDRIRTGLWGLKEIPHHQHFEVSDNLQADQINGTPVDLVVYAEFTDADALEAYKAHQIYQDTITLVRPLRELRIAADIQST